MPLEINLEYLKKRPLSFSTLKHFLKSPKHFMYNMETPFEATPAMVIGKAIHSMILTPERFEKNFILAPQFERRTNAGKLAYKEFKQEHEKKDLLSPEQNLIVGKAVQSVQKSVAAMEILNQIGKTEQRFEYEINGIPFCGYKDGEGDDLIVELKTCRSAHPNDFMKDCYNMTYHLQAGGYTFKDRKRFVYIAIETVEPFMVTVFEASESYLQSGIDLLLKGISDFKFCMDFDLWNTGYEFYLKEGNKFELNLPRWSKA